MYSLFIFTPLFGVFGLIVEVFLVVRREPCVILALIDFTHFELVLLEVNSFIPVVEAFLLLPLVDFLFVLAPLFSILLLAIELLFVVSFKPSVVLLFGNLIHFELVLLNGQHLVPRFKAWVIRRGRR